MRNLCIANINPGRVGNNLNANISERECNLGKNKLGYIRLYMHRINTEDKDKTLKLKMVHCIKL